MTAGKLQSIEMLSWIVSSDTINAQVIFIIYRIIDAVGLLDHLDRMLGIPSKIIVLNCDLSIPSIGDQSWQCTMCNHFTIEITMMNIHISNRVFDDLNYLINPGIVRRPKHTIINFDVRYVAWPAFNLNLHT